MKNSALKRRISMVAVIINTLVFFLLSMLHFSWAFGGKLWYDDVLPTSSNGLHKLNPGIIATLIIAFGLLILGLVTLGNQGMFDRLIKRTYFRYGTLFIAIVFLLRAIGDFKFIGFFKIVKHTRFGTNDTQIFSPLCLVIAFLSVLIFVFEGFDPKAKKIG